MAEKINVKAKINGGHHRKYGMIEKGKTYQIDENDFGAQLFERPSKSWKAPWERDAKTETEKGA